MTQLRHPVLLVESSNFERQAKALLSAKEQRALHLVLADDPASGVPVAGLPGLLKLKFAGCVIFYTVSPDFLKIYLLEIEKDTENPPPPSKQDLALVKRGLEALIKAGIIAGLKRGIKWLWEHFKDDFPLP